MGDLPRPRGKLAQCPHQSPGRCGFPSHEASLVSSNPDHLCVWTPFLWQQQSPQMAEPLLVFDKLLNPWVPRFPTSYTGSVTSRCHGITEGSPRLPGHSCL